MQEGSESGWKEKNDMAGVVNCGLVWLMVPGINSIKDYEINSAIAL